MVDDEVPLCFVHVLSNGYVRKHQLVFDDIRFLLAAVPLTSGDDESLLEKEGPPLLERLGSFLHSKCVLQDEWAQVQLVLTF